MIGRVVTHPKFGRGRIVGHSPSGLDLTVFFFDRGVTLPVGRLSLRPEAEAPPAVVPRREPPGVPSLASRGVLEALKLGVVPGSFVKEFTYGRQRETDHIKAWLAGEGGALAVVGEYGSGKSHLLEYAWHLALREGWAAMRAVLDPEDAACHNPFRVYRQLAAGWKAPGDLDLRTLLWNAAKAGLFREHAYFSLIGAEEPPAAFWEWLEGQHSGADAYGPAMHDHTTAANIYCHLVTGISWAAAQAARLKGVVVILDEAESIASPWLYSYQRDRGPLFLEGLARSTGDEAALASEAVARLRAEPDGPYRGVKTGLLYSGHNRAPYVYRFPTRLKLLIAVAPAPTAVSWLRRRKIQTLEISALSDFALREAFERVYSMYREAFPGHQVWSFEREQVFGRILESCKLHRSTRHFLKGIVEALDLLRHKMDWALAPAGA